MAVVGVGAAAERRARAKSRVETTVRDACDLGYFVTLVDDCCATVTSELHAASLKTLRDRYARIVTAAEAMDDIESALARLSP